MRRKRLGKKAGRRKGAATGLQSQYNLYYYPKSQEDKRETAEEGRKSLIAKLTSG